MKKQAKMLFIYNALEQGYSVKKNADGTYSFTIDKSKDKPLTIFIKRCLSKDK
jgi:hypothetical protein